MRLDGQKVILLSQLLVDFQIDLPDIIFICILFLIIYLLNWTICFLIFDLHAICIGFLDLHLNSIIIRITEHGHWLIQRFIWILHVGCTKPSSNRICLFVGGMPEGSFEIVKLFDISLVFFGMARLGFIHLPLFNLLILS